jgi:hypothetical protein
MICSRTAITFATARVTLNAADGDLLRDSNRLMTQKRCMIYFKVRGVLFNSPGKIGAFKSIAETEQGRRGKAGTYS